MEFVIVIMMYFYVFCVGLIIGSFLNVCIYRIPRKESIIMPASACPICGTKLKAGDLFPVLSYFFLGGQCRYCKNKISFKYPLTEIISGIVCIILFYRLDLTIDFIAAVFLMMVLIAVFFIDMEHMIIPNELVLTALVGGAALVIYNIFYPVQIYGDRNWWNPLLGMVSGFGFLFLVALAGKMIYKVEDAMGMGDVKIFAPIGIFLGWRMTSMVLMLSFVIGALVSIILILLKIKDRKSEIPFGPFIVAATFIGLIY